MADEVEPTTHSSMAELFASDNAVIMARHMEGGGHV